MIYIYPYKLYSKSAKALREGLSRALGYRIKFVLPNGKFNPRRRDKVINWGNSTMPNWKFNECDINNYAGIRITTNKLHSFELMRLYDVSLPEFTTDIDEARQWFAKKGTIVACRTLLNSHSGRGIVLSDSVDSLVTAPLYVKYKKKKHEFRVHVAFDKVIDIQMKRKRDGFKENDKFNHQIRNHHTGWVYCREGINITDELQRQAILAVKAIGLDFGAVDVIYNEKEDKYYVLEVNTAPGLEGLTLDKYVEAFVNA